MIPAIVVSGHVMSLLVARGHCYVLLFLPAGRAGERGAVVIIVILLVACLRGMQLAKRTQARKDTAETYTSHKHENERTRTSFVHENAAWAAAGGVCAVPGPGLPSSGGLARLQIQPVQDRIHGLNGCDGRVPRPSAGHKYEKKITDIIVARALHPHQSLPDPSSPPLSTLTHPKSLSLPTLSGRCLGEGCLRHYFPNLLAHAHQVRGLARHLD